MVHCLHIDAMYDTAAWEAQEFRLIIQHILHDVPSENRTSAVPCITGKQGNKENCHPSALQRRKKKNSIFHCAFCSKRHFIMRLLPRYVLNQGFCGCKSLLICNAHSHASPGGLRTKINRQPVFLPLLRMHTEKSAVCRSTYPFFFRSRPLHRHRIDTSGFIQSNPTDGNALSQCAPPIQLRQIFRQTVRPVRMRYILI